MYLKSIEVQGFKSFAHKIKFEFHNGITGIVGPNGSGKSNVADAVRWVFGEQSAKQLRGSSMQDVIFAGTQLRKPQSFAAVSITLDNEDRALNIDYDEVTVTRKVYRSGESEYMLNGSACRLKDINELFYDTGIGKEDYSIIGQGQIDRILSGKAEERRELFDEAAGIVKFKKRKAAALKKLDAEQEDMVRLTDIMTELERQVGPLSRQSETAKQYLTLRDELRVYDLNAFILDHASFTENLEKLTSNLEITTQELQNRQTAEALLRSDYQDVEDELQMLDEKLEEARNLSNEASEKRSETQGRINVAAEQINTEKSGTQRDRKRIGEIDEEILLKEKQIESCGMDTAVHQDELIEFRRLLEVREAQVRDNAAKIEGYRQVVEESHGKTVDLLTRKSDLQAELTQNETLTEQNELRIREMSGRVAEIEAQGKTLTEENDALQNELNTAEASASDKQEEIRSAQDELRQDEQNFMNAQRDISEYARKYQMAKSRLDTLKAMAERYEGFNPAVRRIMEMRPSYHGICGTVADLFHVESRYQTLVETALGGNFQNIITESEELAKKLVNFLKENRAGRATFLPLDSLKVSGGISDKRILSEPGVIGTADRLVQCDPAYTVAAKYLLERIVAVDTMDNALKAARKYHYSVRMVTLDGEVINVGGSLTGGAFKNNSNMLNRTAELDRLAKEAEEAHKKQDELTAAMNRYRQIRESTAIEIEDLQDELQEIRGEAAEIRAKIDEKRRMITALMLEKKENLRRIDETKQENLQNTAEKEALQKTLDALENENSESNDSADQTKNLLDEAMKLQEILQKEAEGERLKIAAAEQAVLYLSDTAERLKSEIEKLKEDRENLGEDIRKAEEAILGYESEIEQYRSDLEAIEKDIEVLSENFERLNRQRESLAASQHEYFEKQDAAAAEIRELTKEQLRLESQKEKTEEKLSTLTEYLWNEYELTPSEADRYRDESLNTMSQTAIRRHASELKTAIRALGNVNVNAIEQYKEVSERYEFMKNQYEDLKKAEASLQEIVDDLDNGMRRQFSEKFEEIRVAFDEVFKELFGGGQGSIELAPDTDIIDADISIISQPPGKKLQNMMQLSGGEKALTAIALIFAIQKLKPSPFCLLDEIEAALDDSNVGRFAGYLKNLTGKTQFILITHRRGTMVAADRLYGITMQEKGVSTLVSVNLVEQELDA